MTPDEISKLSADIASLLVPHVNNDVVPAIKAIPQTMVPVLKDVIAPTLRSVEDRLNQLTDHYSRLTTETNQINLRIIEIINLLKQDTNK